MNRFLIGALLGAVAGALAVHFLGVTSPPAGDPPHGVSPAAPRPPGAGGAFSYASAVGRAAPSVVNVFTSKVTTERRALTFKDPVLQHYYGADARDVVLVRVYRDWASVEAPCGEPCSTWMEENLPEEGTPEREEWDDLVGTFVKYYSRHSDELYSAPLDLSKN